MLVNNSLPTRPLKGAHANSGAVSPLNVPCASACVIAWLTAASWSRPEFTAAT